jgi:hypothetical protein
MELYEPELITDEMLKHALQACFSSCRPPGWIRDRSLAKASTVAAGKDDKSSILCFPRSILSRVVSVLSGFSKTCGT